MSDVPPSSSVRSRESLAHITTQNQNVVDGQQSANTKSAESLASMITSLAIPVSPVSDANSKTNTSVPRKVAEPFDASIFDKPAKAIVTVPYPQEKIEPFDASIFEKPEGKPSVTNRAYSTVRNSVQKTGQTTSAATSGTAESDKGFDFSMFEKPEEVSVTNIPSPNGYNTGERGKGTKNSTISSEKSVKQHSRISSIKEQRKDKAHISPSNSSIGSVILEDSQYVGMRISVNNDAKHSLKSHGSKSSLNSACSTSAQTPQDDSMSIISKSSTPSSSLFRFKREKRDKREKTKTSSSQGDSVSDMSPAENSMMSGLFQKQFFFQIALPGNEAAEGPWSDASAASPVPQRKINLKHESAPKVHIMTVGKPTKNAEETRRLKIYEHEISINEWDLPIIEKEMRGTPEKALMTIDKLLKSPKSDLKIVDKVLSSANAIKALTGAQLSLVPLHGGWLNPSVASENPAHPIEPATDVIYVVEHCQIHGTLARPLKPLPKNYTREKIRAELGELAAIAIESCFDHHPDSGFSIALVVPVGKSELNYYS